MNFEEKKKEKHFRDENVLHNKQTITTQTFLMTCGPQSFTLLPLRVKSVSILASGTAFPSSPISAGDKSKMTQQK